MPHSVPAPGRSITVTGHGTGHAVPDVAVVRVSAGGRGEALAAAFDLCTAMATQIRTAALRHTRAERIATTGVSLWPFHDQQGQPRGFEARHSFTIGCPDLGAAGALLEELAHSLGEGLQIDDVSLQVSDDSDAQSQARAAAFSDARARAEHLAHLSGATLGAIEQVSEGTGDPAPRGAMFAMRADATLSPGEAAIGAAVRVTWALQD